MAEQKTVRYPKIFGGENSKDLWDLINSIRATSVHEALYAFGCKCQELEKIIHKLEKRIAQLEDI